MLVARGERAIGKAWLRWTVLFGAGQRISLIARTGLVYDTRFVPPSAARSEPRPCLYLLLEGTLAPAGQRPIPGPTALLVSDALLDGAARERPWSFQAFGHPFRVIELRLGPEDTNLSPEPAGRPLALGPETWWAAERFFASAHGDDDAVLTAFAHLVAALRDEDLVSPGFVERSARPAPPAFQLLWRAIGPMVERLELRPTVKDLTAATGTTSRGVDRLVRAFVASVGLVGGSWREASLHWRLRLAALLLSAEGASVAQVATSVGYGSTDAMARAFRDADLPAPSQIQSTLAAGRLARGL